MILLYGSEKQDVSWAEVKKILGNPRAFISTMMQISDFDISSKDPYLIQLMIQILQGIQYTDADVMKVSGALLALFQWVKQVV